MSASTATTIALLAVVGGMMWFVTSGPSPRRNPVVRLSQRETAAWRRGGAGRARLARLFMVGSRRLGRTIVLASDGSFLHTFG